MKRSGGKGSDHLPKHEVVEPLRRRPRPPQPREAVGDARAFRPPAAQRGRDSTRGCRRWSGPARLSQPGLAVSVAAAAAETKSNVEREHSNDEPRRLRPGPPRPAADGDGGMHRGGAGEPAGRLRTTAGARRQLRQALTASRGARRTGLFQRRGRRGHHRGHRAGRRRRWCRAPAAGRLREFRAGRLREHRLLAPGRRGAARAAVVGSRRCGWLCGRGRQGQLRRGGGRRRPRRRLRCRGLAGSATVRRGQLRRGAFSGRGGRGHGGRF